MEQAAESFVVFVAILFWALLITIVLLSNDFELDL